MSYIQNERDAKAMQQTLVLASDTFVFALACWLLALTTQLYTKLAITPKTQTWARAGYGTAGTFMALGAAAAVCVSSRLFQTHYQEHGPRLFEK